MYGVMRQLRTRQMSLYNALGVQRPAYLHWASTQLGVGASQTASTLHCDFVVGMVVDPAADGHIPALQQEQQWEQLLHIVLPDGCLRADNHAIICTVASREGFDMHQIVPEWWRCMIRSRECHASAPRALRCPGQ